MRVLQGEKPLIMPQETMLGALCYYITHASPLDFQPMKANFGLMPPLNGEKIHGKRARGQEYSHRSLNIIQDILSKLKIDG